MAASSSSCNGGLTAAVVILALILIGILIAWGIMASKKNAAPGVLAKHNNKTASGGSGGGAEKWQADALKANAFRNGNNRNGDWAQNAAGTAGWDYGGQNPTEYWAQQKFERVREHPDLHGCYAPSAAAYDPRAGLVPDSGSLAPPFQQALAGLPAMRHVHFQEEYAANNMGPRAREGMDLVGPATLDAASTSPDDDFDDRAAQTAGANVGGPRASSSVKDIYDRNRDGKGISLVNQDSTLRDTSKLMPRVDPERQNERMVQAGPSIEDIAKRVPKAQDLMNMVRRSRRPVHSIPREQPPLYTTGLNAVRSTVLPRLARPDTSCAIGISPLEVSDLVDYGANPFLNSSRATAQPPNYAV